MTIFINNLFMMNLDRLLRSFKEIQGHTNIYCSQ